MDELYEPASDFLKAVAADEAPLSGPFGEANLRRLIAMTRDIDRSNRDWATFLLAQVAVDTSEVCAALLVAVADTDDHVRAEALAGLARRARSLALPFVKAALSADLASPPIFEAAALIADRSLVEDLRRFAEPSDDPTFDELVARALLACLDETPRTL